MYKILFFKINNFYLEIVIDSDIHFCEFLIGLILFLRFSLSHLQNDRIIIRQN
jgi:hypothetical protein